MIDSTWFYISIDELRWILRDKKDTLIAFNDRYKEYYRLKSFRDHSFDPVLESIIYELCYKFNLPGRISTITFSQSVIKSSNVEHVEFDLISISGERIYKKLNANSIEEFLFKGYCGEERLIRRRDSSL